MSDVLKQFAVNRSAETRVQTQIEDFLINAIRSRRLATGTRLPNTTALAADWGVNLVAVQQAMQRLRANGFIARKPRVGTYVLGATTQLQLGIVVRGDLDNVDDHYNRALVQAIQDELAIRDGSSVVLDRVQARLFADDTPATTVRRNLCRLREQQALIAVGLRPSHLTELTKRVKAPMVIVGNDLNESHVATDYRRFGTDAVRELAARDCRRILVISPFQQAEFALGLRAGADQTDGVELEFRPLGYSRGKGRRELAAELIVQVLEEWAEPARIPDAILVSDDIAMLGLANPLSAFLHERHRELTIATLANEGPPLDFGLPVLRYTFPVRAKAQAAVEGVVNMLKGEQMMGPTLVQGSFVEDQQCGS